MSLLHCNLGHLKNGVGKTLKTETAFASWHHSNHYQSILWFFLRFFSHQNINAQGLYISFMFMLSDIGLGLPVNYLPINKNVRGLYIDRFDIHVIAYWASGFPVNYLPTIKNVQGLYINLC